MSGHQRPALGLPWQPISSLTPVLGADPVIVWNGGKGWQLAVWRHGWDPMDRIASPCWCDGALALDPQPTHWLAFSPPGANP